MRRNGIFHGSRRLTVKRIPFGLMLLAGCATSRVLAPGPDPRIAYIERANQEINESENRCIGEVMTSNEHQVASTAASPGAFLDLQTQQSVGERDRRLNECRANAERERERLSARDRSNYQDAAHDERDRNSLMMILTTSRPH